MPVYTITITQCHHLHIWADNEEEAIEQAYEHLLRDEPPVSGHSIVEGEYPMDDCSKVLDHLHKS